MAWRFYFLSVVFSPCGAKKRPTVGSSNASLAHNLRSRRRAVRPARQRPLIEEFLAWELGRQRLVKVDPQAGPIVRVHIAVANLGAAGEHLIQHIRKDIRLLNAEVRAADIKVQVGRVADRRDIARAVPGSAYAV